MDSISMSRWKKCDNLLENLSQASLNEKLEYLDGCLDEVKRLLGVRDSAVGEIRGYVRMASELIRTMRHEE